jgi:hypothetical protein
MNQSSLRAILGSKRGDELYNLLRFARDFIAFHSPAELGFGFPHPSPPKQTN